MPGDRITVWLMALGAVLALTLGAQMLFGAVDDSRIQPLRPEPVSQPAIAASPPPEGVPELALLTETVDRPLFSPDRRPPEPPAGAEQVPEAAVAASTSPAPTLTLSAVIIEPGSRLALLKAASSVTLVRKREGESLEGWTVTEIRPDGVTLTRGENRHELVLRTFKPAPRPSPVGPTE